MATAIPATAVKAAPVPPPTEVAPPTEAPPPPDAPTTSLAPLPTGVLAGIACPLLGAVPANERFERDEGTQSSLSCLYSNGSLNSVQVIIEPRGSAGGQFCFVSDGSVDSASETSNNQLRTVATGITSARASISSDRLNPPAPPEAFIAVAQELLAAVEPLAEPCAPVHECSSTLGELVLDDFLSDVPGRAVTGNDDGAWTMICEYVLADGVEQAASAVSVLAGFATADAPLAARIEQCIVADGFDRGVLTVDGPDELAVRGQITVRQPQLAFDLDVASAELDRMFTAIRDVAGPCADVVVEPLYTPLPAWLANTLDARFATGVPTMEITPEGIRMLVEPLDATGQVTPPAASTPSTAATTVTSESTPAGANTTVPGVVTAAASPPPGESASSPDSGSSSLFSIAMRVFGWIALALSIVGIALALFTLRRQSRVRPVFDVIRIGIMVGVAIVTALVFGRSTPTWVFVVALVVGGVLGVVQGRNLDVTVEGSKVMASRSDWAIVAFLVGLIVSQVSGLLGRVGIIGLGIGLTMLSAALATGIVIARQPQVRAARAGRLPAVGLLVLLAGPVAFLLVPDGDGRAASPDPSAEASAVEAQLEAMIDWDTVRLAPVFGDDLGAPLVEVALPNDLGSIPDPLTVNRVWTRPFLEREIAYDLTETFTFTPTADGICCLIAYGATGAQNDGGTIDAIQIDATLGNLMRLNDGVFTNDPFGSQEVLDDAGECGREVANRPTLGAVPGSYTTYLVGATDYLSSSSSPEPPGLTVYTDCELDGFTSAEAFAKAPPAPPAADPGRIANGVACPVYQEVYAALDDPVDAGQGATGDLVRLFTAPNSPACSGTATTGDERRGAVRDEFMYSFATAEPAAEAARQLDITQTFADRTMPHEIAVEDRCVVGDDGVPRNGEGQTLCLHRTFHEFGDGRLTIWTNTDLADGPDTKVRGDFPWGSYLYNCHHCTVGDPHIAETIERWHEFGHTWNTTGMLPEPDGVGEDGALEGDDIASGTEDVTTSTESKDSSDDGTDEPDSVEVDSDEVVSAEEAAAVALVSLLGAAGIAWTSLAESGRSASELLDAFRDGGVDGLGDLLDEAAPVESPDDIVSGWDPSQETFRDMTRAERDRLEGVDRTQRRDGRLGRDAAELADIRADRARIDRLTEQLRRRDELEAALAAAEAEQTRWSDPDYVEQVIAQDAYDGMLRDIDGLPGELRELARTINELVNDPETWTVLGETLSDTAYDAAGMMSPIEFGDGRSNITETSQQVGELSSAIARAAAADPIGFVTQMSPLGDLADSIDADRTLGQRLASLGMALTDVLPAIGGASLARDASNLIEAAHDLERATDLAGAARDLERATDLAGTTRDLGRATDTIDIAHDAGRSTGIAHDAERAAEMAREAERSAEMARRPGGSLDDVEAQIARQRAGLGDELGSEADRLRREAWEANRRAGAAAVDDFAHEATRPIDLDVETVAEVNARQREAALRLQTNKQGLQEIKNQPLEVQQAFVNQMREIYDETDAAVLDWATDYINRQQSGPLAGVEITGDLRLDRIEGGRHVFVDGVGNEIALFEPTNARPGQISVGADRDFTAYVRPAGSSDPPFSLPRDDVRPVYNDALYEAMGGDEMRQRLGIPEVTPEEVIAEAQRRGIDPPSDPASAARRQTADRVAERLDQAVTDDLDPEAYRNVNTVINRPFGEIGDAQQVGLTATHKGEEWSWRAEHSSSQAIGQGPDGAGGGLTWAELSEDQRAEGIRQIVKQNGNQVQPRLDALQRQTEYLVDQGLLPPGTPVPRPDERLDRAIEILAAVRDEGVAPVDVERILREQTGMTVADVAKANGERIHAMEQLRPAAVADLQRRMDSIADRLTRELADQANPVDRIPTEQMVWDRLLSEGG